MTTTNDLAANEHLAELERRVRDGDTTVTAAALAKARDAVHLEALQVEASARASEAQAAQRLEDERSQFRATTLAALNAELSDLQDLYHAAVEAGTALRERLPAFRRHVTAAETESKRLGIRSEVSFKTMAFDKAWNAASNEAAGKVRSTGHVVGSMRIISHPLHRPEYVEQKNAELHSRLEATGQADRQRQREQEWNEAQRRLADIKDLRREVAEEFGVPVSNLTARNRDELVDQAQLMHNGRLGSKR